jgi:hypothetical protein
MEGLRLGRHGTLAREGLYYGPDTPMGAYSVMLGVGTIVGSLLGSPSTTIRGGRTSCRDVCDGSVEGSGFFVA